MPDQPDPEEALLRENRSLRARACRWFDEAAFQQARALAHLNTVAVLGGRLDRMHERERALQRQIKNLQGELTRARSCQKVLNAWQEGYDTARREFQARAQEAERRLSERRLSERRLMHKKAPDAGG